MHRSVPRQSETATEQPNNLVSDSLLNLLVILPDRNEERYFKRTLDSVLNQDCGPDRDGIPVALIEAMAC